MLRYLLSAFLLVVTCKSAPDKPIAVNFNGGTWVFPLTVGDAVKRYSLAYKPPGYYYTEMDNGSTVDLGYSYQPGDFFNEHQAKEVLYNREVNTYTHTFPFRSGLIDSLHRVLEVQFKRKMVMCVDTQRFGLNRMSESLRRSLPNEGTVPYELMRVDSLLTIGLRHKPNLTKYKQAIEVCLFYNQLQAKIKARMIGF
ncbi:hypothetical protein GCM10028808_14490 [Spirosoma migulaei]